MDYSRKTLKVYEKDTGKVNYVYDGREYSKHQLRGLSMGRINVEAYDELQEMFNFRKSNLLVLKYIRDNLDSNNLFKIHNATKTANILKVSRNIFYKTIKELLQVGVLVEIEPRTYDVNPFIFMSTKIKSKDDKVLLQDTWAQKFSNNNKENRFKLKAMSEIIIDRDTYMEYLKSDKWKEISKECKNLANNKCIRCGSEDELEIHHITYKNIYNEEQNDIECLCHLCHTTIHRLN